MTERLTNLATSVLAAPITTTGAITPTVTNAAKFPGSGDFRIRIDSEHMLVTVRTGNTLTITAPNRGIEGSAAATHLAGVDVRHVLTATGLDTRVTETIAALRGVGNGYASLDGAAKIPLAQLPAGAEIFRGTWNVATNATSDGVTLTQPQSGFTSGMEYRVATGGTRFSITWVAGDLAIYDGANWQQIGGAGGGAVTSVAGRTGAVVLTAADIGTLVADLAAKATQASVDALTASLAAKADDTDLQIVGPQDAIATHGSPYTLVTADGGKVFDMGASANQVLVLPASGLTQNFVAEVENTTTAFRLELRSASGSLIETVLSASRVASVWVKPPFGVARCRFWAASGFWSVSGDVSLTAVP